MTANNFEPTNPHALRPTASASTYTDLWISPEQDIAIIDQIMPRHPEPHVTVTYNILGGATLHIRLHHAGRERLVTIYPDGTTDIHPAPYTNTLDVETAAHILARAHHACLAEESRYVDYGPRQAALNQAQNNLLHAATALRSGRYIATPAP